MIENEPSDYQELPEAIEPQENEHVQGQEVALIADEVPGREDENEYRFTRVPLRKTPAKPEGGLGRDRERELAIIKDAGLAAKAKLEMGIADPVERAVAKKGSQSWSSSG